MAELLGLKSGVPGEWKRKNDTSCRKEEVSYPNSVYSTCSDTLRMQGPLLLQ